MQHISTFPASLGTNHDAMRGHPEGPNDKLPKICAPVAPENPLNCKPICCDAVTAAAAAAAVVFIGK